jgi:hypothetical protein
MYGLCRCCWWICCCRGVWVPGYRYLLFVWAQLWKGQGLTAVEAMRLPRVTIYIGLRTAVFCATPGGG